MPKDLDDFMSKLGTPDKAAPPAPDKPTAEPKEEGTFSMGVKQGLLGYAEAPLQFAEHGVRQLFPGFRINPFGLRDWAADYRRRAESSLPGLAGEVAGTVAPMFIPVGGWMGGLARAALGAEDIGRVASLAATGARAGRLFAAAPERGSQIANMARDALRASEEFAAKSPRTAMALKSGAMATMAQPADDANFGSEMQTRFLLGAGLGGLAANAQRLMPAAERVGQFEPTFRKRPPTTREKTFKTEGAFEQVEPGSVELRRGPTTASRPFKVAGEPETRAGRFTRGAERPEYSAEQQAEFQRLHDQIQEEMQGRGPNSNWLKRQVARFGIWTLVKWLALPHTFGHFGADVAGHVAGSGGGMGIGLPKTATGIGASVAAGERAYEASRDRD